MTVKYFLSKCMLMKRNFELSSNNTIPSLLFFENSLRAFFSTVKCSYVYIFFISISDFLMLTSHNIIATEKTCYINQNEIWIHAKNIHFFYNHGTKVIGTWINIQFCPRRNHKKVSVVHSYKNTNILFLSSILQMQCFSISLDWFQKCLLLISLI